MSSQAQVMIYTTPTCHFCHAAKDFFNENNVKFAEYDVARDLVKRQEMVQKSGQMGVPVIYVNDRLVIGFDEEQLRSLLNL